MDGFLDVNDNDSDDTDAPEMVDVDGDGTVEADDQIDSGEVSDYIDRVWKGCPGYEASPENQVAGTASADTLNGTPEWMGCAAGLPQTRATAAPDGTSSGTARRTSQERSSSV